MRNDHRDLLVKATLAVALAASVTALGLRGYAVLSVYFALWAAWLLLPFAITFWTLKRPHPPIAVMLGLLTAAAVALFAYFNLLSSTERLSSTRSNALFFYPLYHSLWCLLVLGGSLLFRRPSPQVDAPTKKPIDILLTALTVLSAPFVYFTLPNLGMIQKDPVNLLLPFLLPVWIPAPLFLICVLLLVRRWWTGLTRGQRTLWVVAVVMMGASLPLAILMVLFKIPNRAWF
jgi:hypothetical protein